jgi:hypothetical protein
MREMGKPDLEQRIRRLNELTKGLGAEVRRWRRGADPLTLAERRHYRDGIQDALAGAEQARVALVQALERLEQEERDLPQEMAPAGGVEAADVSARSGRCGAGCRGRASVAEEPLHK